MSSYFEKKQAQQNQDTSLSWRERDAKKEGRSYAAGPQKKTNLLHEKIKQSQAKKNLDKLFTPKKNEAQSKAWQALIALKRNDFNLAAQKFIENHGMPKVWEDLLKLLDSTDENIIEQVLDHIEQNMEHQQDSTLKLTTSKLRVTKLMFEDPHIVDLIKKLIEKIDA